MSTIRFELRKEKADKDGLSPIRIIYQIKGDRKYYSTGEKTYSENWSEEDQQAVYYKLVEGEDGKKKKVKGKLLELEVNKLNGRLTDFKRDIEKIEDKFKANGIVYDVEMVINELTALRQPAAKKESSSKELFSFIDTYIENHSSTRVKGSLTVYKSLKSHLQGYEEQTGKKITFDKIDYTFFQGFQNYLVSLTKTELDKETQKPKTVKLLNNITVAKQLSTLKTFLSYARTHGHDVSNKYTAFKIKRENDLEVIALTQKEFEILRNLDLSKRPSWDQVRDVFIFSCLTGLRYSDLAQLKWEHIKGDVIDITAKKTGHKTKISLNTLSKAILNKYAEESRPLPIISNQKSNKYLKALCRWAGLTTKEPIVRKYGNKTETEMIERCDLISMHTGRKTFATLSLEAGVPAQKVMKAGGWKDYKSFSRYMNITDESAMQAISDAWETKIIKPKLKAV
ncbi:MAG: site-specific integrase [Flavisolibacter sp.]|nr:site-specific integrase [Flavisolibacter sp.]